MKPTNLKAIMFSGIAVGVALGIASILVARRVHGEGWLYSAALILLPLVYVAFALSAREWEAASLELLLGAPFTLAGAAFLIFRSPVSTFAIGLLWVLHAAYNVVHDKLLVNGGVPGWYPLFSAAVDLVIGFYVIWLASTLAPHGLTVPAPAADRRIEHTSPRRQQLTR